MPDQEERQPEEQPSLYDGQNSEGQGQQPDFNDEEMKLLDESYQEVLSEERSEQSGVQQEQFKKPETMTQVIRYARNNKFWIDELLNGGVAVEQVQGAQDRLNAEGWFGQMGDPKEAENITEADLTYLEEEKPWDAVDESNTAD